MQKPRWEQLVRLRVLRSARHSSANDSARSLLVAAAAVVALCFTLCPFFGRSLWPALSGFAVSFIGLALQQYAWYTVYTFSECWADEGAIVVMIITLSSGLLAVINLLVALVMPLWPRVVIQGASSLGILTCHRWAPWGSLFDGNDKPERDRAR